MNSREHERGAALISIMLVMIFICGLLYLSYLRTEVGHRAVKARYLAGVARDLAENGVEAQRYLIGRGAPRARRRPLRASVGTMARHEGGFESYALPLGDGAYGIFSRGELISPRGEVAGAVEIKAEVKQGLDGSWTVTSWRVPVKANGAE